MPHHSFCQANQTNLPCLTERSSTVAKSQVSAKVFCKNCVTTVLTKDTASSNPELCKACMVLAATPATPAKRTKGYDASGVRKFARWSRNSPYPFVNLSPKYLDKEFSDSDLAIRWDLIVAAIMRISHQNLSDEATFDLYGLYPDEIDRNAVECEQLMNARRISRKVDYRTIVRESKWELSKFVS